MVASCWRSPDSGAVTAGERGDARSSLQTFIRAADERLEDLFKRLDEGPRRGWRDKRRRAHRKNLTEKIAALRQKRGRCDTMVKSFERTGQGRVSLTEATAAPWPRIPRPASATTSRVAVNAEGIVEQA